jgi:hypothetical protein
VKVPWIRKLPAKFTPDTRGNNSIHHHRYTETWWRKESPKFFRGKPCATPHCIRQAYCTDHMVRVNDGGSMWDRRNWQGLCKPCHDHKSGKEANGYIMPYVDTEHGRIPAERAHLPPDIVRQSTVKRKRK